MPAIVPPRAASAAAIDPDIVPGALDEPPLISADMHPPVDLAEDLERFNARLATYLKPEDITTEVRAPLPEGTTVVASPIPRSRSCT